MNAAGRDGLALLRSQFESCAENYPYFRVAATNLGSAAWPICEAYQSLSPKGLARVDKDTPKWMIHAIQFSYDARRVPSWLKPPGSHRNSPCGTEDELVAANDRFEQLARDAGQLLKSHWLPLLLETAWSEPEGTFLRCKRSIPFVDLVKARAIYDGRKTLESEGEIEYYESSAKQAFEELGGMHTVWMCHIEPFTASAELARYLLIQDDQTTGKSVRRDSTSRPDRTHPGRRKNAERDRRLLAEFEHSYGPYKQKKDGDITAFALRKHMERDTMSKALKRAFDERESSKQDH